MHYLSRVITNNKIKKKIQFISKTYSRIADNEKVVLTIKDMPHPRSLPILGTKLDLLAAGSGNKLHDYIDARHKQLGPIFYECLSGNTKLVFVSEPALMKTLFQNLEGKFPAHILPDPWILYEQLYGSKRGLFFMNGEEWLDNRRIMNRHLLKESSDKWLENPIKETITKFVANWKDLARHNNFIPNLESEFYRLSTDVIITILLGSKSPLSNSGYNEELVLKFSENVKKIFQTTTKLYAYPLKWCERLNLKAWRDFKNSVDTSLALAQRIVSEILKRRHESDGLVHKLCQENVSDIMITRLIADFVIAAGDTTAYTTLWILHLLSENKDAVNDLRQSNLASVKHIVKEAMRLYPVAPFLTRILPKESILGRFQLQEGTPIIASIYTSGRDEQNFSRANEFLPYRWDRNDLRKKDLANHTPSASLPFAFGSRSCIGKKIAMIQLSEIVHQLVENFDFKHINNVKIEPITSQVLVPDIPIQMNFSIRNK